MLKNYLKVAIRNLIKHKMFSLINVCGLATGMACAILILLWVRDEISFDRFHENVEAIYRVNWDFKWQGNEGIGPGTPPPLAATLTDNIPEVQAATRLRPMPNAIIRAGDKFFDEDGVVAADSNFFNLFSFSLLAGDASTALRQPNSVVLTQEMAAKLFGSESPMGKTFLIDEPKRDFYGTYQNLFTVTGVVKNPPSNSHVRFSMLTSMASYPEVAWRNWSWVWMQVVTYVKLQDGAAPETIDAKIHDLVGQHAPAAFKRVGFSYEELIASGGRWDFVLQPMTDVYLGSAAIGNRLGPLGNRTQVHLFGIIAVLVLGIACINFMNLATARSASRAKEIGVRKVLGSSRKAGLGQFLVESIFFSFLAMLVALFLVEVSLAPFNRLAGKSLEFNLLDPSWLPGALFLLAILVGLVSGSYPGLYLSSIQPALAVKGPSTSPTGGRRLRNILVAAQFAVTIGLIACTLLVKQQMDFIRQTDLGFERRGVIVISNRNHRLGGKAEAYRDALMNHPQVLSASLSTGVPPTVSAFQDAYKVEGREEHFQLTSYLADEHFLSTLGLSIAEGRGFAKEFADSSSVILNEAAVQLLGLSDPVGKTIVYPGGGNTKYRVIGVMKDFNFWSLYSPILPFALFHASSKSYTIPESYVVVRVRPDDLSDTIRLLESEWKSFASATPFEYTFLDDNLEAEYRSAYRLGEVFLIFSALTILIACIGLFGLAAFATERRTKEIGIRKVLGASVSGIVALLSREFAKLVLVANVIAWPVAYYVMNNWLQDFAYRIEIGWWVFALAGGMTLLIALLTVSFQTLKAALANPVEALRYE
jgi:putative ABC transport system permease protein